MVSTPSPLSYFGWIVGLLTVAAVVVPFLSSSSWPIKLAEAVIHLIIGIAIGGLVSNAAASATARPARPRRYLPRTHVAGRAVAGRLGG